MGSKLISDTEKDLRHIYITNFIEYMSQGAKEAFNMAVAKLYTVDAD